MSGKDSKRRVIEAVVAGVILSPLALFSDVVRSGVVGFFGGLGSIVGNAAAWVWSVICAFGRFLAMPITFPPWLCVVIVIVTVVGLKAVRLFRARAIEAESRPDDVKYVPAAVPLPQAPAAPEPPAAEPDFRPTRAQRRIVEHLARHHPGTQNLTELHYQTQLPTQAHTEREVEGLAEAGIVEIGSSYMYGTWYSLSKEGRDYALDNGMFPGARGGA